MFYILNTINKLNGHPWAVLPFPFNFVSKWDVSETNRVRPSCHSWPLWEELVPSEPAHERPVTNHIHDCHMMNIQSMMANTKKWSLVHSTITLSNSSFLLQNISIFWTIFQGAVSIRKTVLPGMAIPMLKIRRPNGRLIFNMEIAIRR